MSVRTVDSHQHFWELARLDYKWPTPDMPLYRDYTPADLKPHLDACGVAGTVIVQAHQSVDEARWLLSLADEHDWLEGVVGWVDLKDPAVGDTLDELSAHPKFKGVRHLWQGETPEWNVQPDVLRGLREMAKRDIPYDVMAKPPHLAYLPDIARAVPDLRMVVDHIAKPLIADGVLEPWLERMKASAVFPQICCKVSGLVTEADLANWTVADLRPFVEPVVEMFGFERLMYGSDWPVCTLAGTYEQVHAACLEATGNPTGADRDRLLGGTAREYYGLE